MGEKPVILNSCLPTITIYYNSFADLKKKYMAQLNLIQQFNFYLVSEKKHVVKPVSESLTAKKFSLNL